MKHVVVQPLARMPYVLGAWRDELESKNRLSCWNCLRSRALVFEAPRALLIADPLKALCPTRVVLVAGLP